MDSRDPVTISTWDRPTLVDMNVVDNIFDPSTDHHLWGRWRTAVNGKLVDDYKLREVHKQLGGFSHSLTEAPYSEYLRVTRDTRNNAYRMMTSGEDPYQNPSRRRTLKTGQFLYYGIPRLVRNPDFKSRDDNDIRHNVSNESRDDSSTSRDDMDVPRDRNKRGYQNAPRWSYYPDSKGAGAYKGRNNYSMLLVHSSKPAYPFY